MIRRDAQDTIHSLLKGFPIVTTALAVREDHARQGHFSGQAFTHLWRTRIIRLPRTTPFVSGALSRWRRARRGAALSGDLFLSSIHVDADGRMGCTSWPAPSSSGCCRASPMSLAGRTAFSWRLPPFSLGELANAGKATDRIDQMLHTGGYPPLYDRQIGVRSYSALRDRLPRTGRPSGPRTRIWRPSSDLCACVPEEQGKF